MTCRPRSAAASKVRLRILRPLCSAAVPIAVYYRKSPVLATTPDEDDWKRLTEHDMYHPELRCCVSPASDDYETGLIISFAGASITHESENIGKSAHTTEAVAALLSKITSPSRLLSLNRNMDRRPLFALFRN